MREPPYLFEALDAVAEGDDKRPILVSDGIWVEAVVIVSAIVRASIRELMRREDLWSVRADVRADWMLLQDDDLLGAA
jgi:hypothetical protein